MSTVYSINCALTVASFHINLVFKGISTFNHVYVTTLVKFLFKCHISNDCYTYPFI